jgi:C_GCAxxG_C_C family probable redox protein
MNREDKAVELRNSGYNCAQAVICASADITGLDEAAAFALTEGLGSGLGCTQGTCGALNAACMVISMQLSSCHLDHPDSKQTTYPIMRSMLADFQSQAGAIRCRDLKGIENGKILCECEECVRIACRLIDKYRRK